MLDSILAEYISKGNDTFPSIIEFIEAKWGWNQNLLPTQKFVFKLIYGLPLDKSTRTIRITDKFNERCYEMLSEFDYFKFLKSEERINLETPPEQPMHEIVEAIGRRGSKSVMASFLCGYEIYRLLYEIKDPHKHFGITQTDEIRVMLVSNAKEQAEIIYNQIKEGARNCERLRKYISSDTKEKLLFYTPAQIEKYALRKDIPLKDHRGLVSAFVGTSNSRNVRGAGCITLILDEFAHFVTNSGVKSDASVYEALSPTVSAFGILAKKVLISSPWSKVGKFYELFKKGMEKPELQKTMLVLCIPTWGMNKEIKPEYLRHEYETLGRQAYNCEYGAIFSDSKYTWLEDEKIVRESVFPNITAPTMGRNYIKYYWAIDQAQKSDAFALAITHREADIVVADYVKDYYGDAETRENIRDLGFDTPHLYDLTRNRVQYPQDYEDLVKELLALSKKFPVAEGIMDQWSGVLMHQIFEKHGLKNFQVVNFTDKMNSDIYDLWRLLMTLGQFKMYDNPYLINQILSLESEKRSKGITCVQAPDRRGFHDDLCDAVARSVWLTIQGPNNSKGTKRRGFPAMVGGAAHIGQSSVSYTAYQNSKKLLHRSDHRLF